MSSTARKRYYVWLLLMAPLIILTCSNNSIEPIPASASDYDLIYFPGGGGGASPYLSLTYSTRTGVVLDTCLTPYYINDMKFISDGSMVIYSGVLSVPPTNQECAIWINNNLTGETLFSSGDCPGERLVLAPGEDYVLSTGEAFRLYSFPALVPIYTPASNQATGGGFLTSPGKAYYFYDNRDTLYTIDFSNAALIVETAIPLRMNGNPFYPSNAALHASGKKLVFIEGDPAGTTDIMILDSDNLGFIEGAHADWWYRDIEIHPDGNRVFLSCYWSLLDDESRNRVDIYNIGSGQFTSFLGVHDIEGETAFQPQQMVITPDGGMIYFRSGLYTGGMTITSEFTALGISVASRQLINRIKPENPVASLIAIDPTRHE